MAAPNRVLHLDSSAVVELCFWDSKGRNAVLNAVQAGDRLCITPYVLFELARGFLSYLIILHNKALQLREPAEVITYARTFFSRPYKMHAMLQSYETFRFQLSKNTSLTQKQELSLFQGDLRRRIRRGWRDTLLHFRADLNKPGCRSDLASPKVEDTGCYLHDIPSNDCGKVANCRVRDYIYKHSVELRKSLKPLSAVDAETDKRSKALRELLKLPNVNFKRRDCWSVGDILIVHEVGEGAAVATKNVKHFAPIAEQFRKVVVEIAAPKRLQPDK